VPDLEILEIEQLDVPDMNVLDVRRGWAAMKSVDQLLNRRFFTLDVANRRARRGNCAPSR
jgi:hypothetical protein